ncbi:MAG: hypothetical protein VXV82_01750, partial [Bacteroidota bacterium]|nr:hypothetical protein [Bacteroidota bacterium]
IQHVDKELSHNDEMTRWNPHYSSHRSAKKPAKKRGTEEAKKARTCVLFPTTSYDALPIFVSN